MRKVVVDSRGPTGSVRMAVGRCACGLVHDQVMVKVQDGREDHAVRVLEDQCLTCIDDRVPGYGHREVQTGLVRIARLPGPLKGSVSVNSPPRWFARPLAPRGAPCPSPALTGTRLTCARPHALGLVPVNTAWQGIIERNRVPIHWRESAHANRSDSGTWLDSAKHADSLAVRRLRAARIGQLCFFPFAALAAPAMVRGLYVLSIKRPPGDRTMFGNSF